MDATSGSSKRLWPAYLLAFAFFAGLITAIRLLADSKAGLNITPTYVAAIMTVGIVFPALLAIPAGIITAIGAIWRKKDRGILFMRSHFYLMAFLIPMSVLKDVFQLILGD